VIEDALLPKFTYLMKKLVWYLEKNVNAHHWKVTNICKHEKRLSNKEKTTKKLVFAVFSKVIKRSYNFSVFDRRHVHACSPSYTCIAYWRGLKDIAVNSDTVCLWLVDHSYDRYFVLVYRQKSFKNTW